MKTIKTIILILTISIFTSCQENEICESNCFNVISMEYEQDGFLYIFENECSGEQVRVKTNIIDFQYKGQDVKVGNTICEFQTYK